ncbi:carboxypeptidase-like regulatory domain-containing protein [Aeromicrobium sp. UC242_57]|uniref:carboxypeptidase-like regulatory domain-containing protein n=1 Tax=Aeromicrobium sp. UC242_57 TaxID=3374624 RepID=UPI00378D5F21
MTACLIFTGMTIQSAQAADTGSITGKVFTKAVGGAEVAVKSGYIYLYRQGSDGYYSSVDRNPSTPLTDSFQFVGNTFTLSGLKAGNYKFEIAGVEAVDGGRYQREHYNDAEYIYDATAIAVSTGVKTVDKMVLEPAGQISGRVTDAAGQPLANATVSFERTSDGGSFGVSTNANGEYSSTNIFGGGLVKGAFRVAASHYPYSGNPDTPSHEQEYWQNATSYGTATPVNVTPGATTGGINFTLDVAPRIRLTVKDAAGRPLANTNVGIWVKYNGTWGPYQAGPNTTDSKGVFRKTTRIGDEYKFFITPPASVGGTTKWFDGAYSEAAATVVKTTDRQVRNIEIKLDPAPTVSGTVRAGKALAAKPSPGSQLKTDLTYQWTAGGAAVRGATKSTFKLTNTQAGKAVAVRITGKTADSATRTETSAVTAKVTGVLSPKKVTVTGTRKVSKKLRADTAAWGAKPVKLKYRWYRNGKAISGQTNRYYKLRKADKGKRISVRVYQSKTSYLTASKLSAKTGKVK